MKLKYSARKNIISRLFLCLLIAFIVCPAALAKTTFRLAIPDPEKSSVGRAAQEFADLVDQKTDGEVQFQIFPNGVLFSGDQNAAINQMGSGALDGLILASSVYASFEPRMNAISLPYLFDDYDQLQRYLSGEPGQQLIESISRMNIHGLGFFLRTFRDVTTRETPITTIDDFKGLTLRTPNNPLFVALFKALGANPTPMAFSEVYSALQLKAIDGQENPVEVPYNNRFYEVQAHLNMTQHVADAFLLAMSDNAWNRVSEEYRDDVQAAAEEMIANHDQEEIQQEKQIIEDLKKQGMQVHELTPETLAKIKEKARGLYDKFSESIGKDFVQESVDFVNE